MKQLSKETCLMSVDVEDWFHLIGVGLDYQFKEATGGIDSWEDRECRVDYATRWILDLFDEHNVRSTFFILGWVAEKYPELVLEIHNRGHEIASHSYWHRLVYQLSPEEFRKDLRRSIDVLQDASGTEIYGFRASTCSIVDWATDIILEEGLLYDSSLFPSMYHDVYGKLSGVDDTKAIEKLPNGLWEVKFSSVKLGGKSIPWSGGGYFRLLPYELFKLGAKRILRQDGTFQFYIHPWEVDEDPPVLDSMKLPYKLRRYTGISKMPKRMNRLLCDFDFMPVIDLVRQHEKQMELADAS